MAAIMAGYSLLLKLVNTEMHSVSSRNWY